MRDVLIGVMTSPFSIACAHARSNAIAFRAAAVASAPDLTASRLERIVDLDARRRRNVNPIFPTPRLYLEMLLLLRGMALSRCVM